MSLFTDQLLVEILGIVVAVLVVACIYIKRSYQYWEERNVPYLPPKFICGNIQAPHRRTIGFGEDIANLYKEAKYKGWRHIGIYALTAPVYMPIDLDIIKNIMSKDFNHFFDRGLYVNEPISAHLFSLGGVKWKIMRKKFSAAFTSEKIRAMFPIVANCGTVMENYITHEHDEDEPLDIKSLAVFYSTDIIGACALGLDCNTFKEPDTPFRNIGLAIFRPNKWGALKLTLANIFQDIARFLGIRVIPQEVDQFFTKVVEDAIKYKATEKVVQRDFLQMLIDIKNGEKGGNNYDGTSLTLQEIVAQCFVFFIGGYETTATTMAFALYELAVNPDIQEKARTEIETVLAKHNNNITYDALNELKYMGQVIDETLRKYPAVPVVTRKCTEVYQVPGCNVVLEKGTRVFIPIRGIHYDEDYHEAPETFDPDRFSDDRKQSRHSYAHIPFGEGFRICIGMRFGIMQTKVGLLSILKNFNVRLNKKTTTPLKFEPSSIIPNTKGGIWLDLKKLK